MKVVKQTALELTLQNRPLLLWILGSAVIGLSIVMVVKLPNRDLDTLTCTRSDPQSGTCEIERLSWRGLETDSISTSSLKEAGVERRVHVNSQGDRHVSYLLVLSTEQDAHIVSYNGTIADKERIAEHVNQFLAGSEESLVETIEEVHIGKWIMSGIVGLLGLAAILSDEITWIFDKSTNRVQLIKRGIQGVRVADHSLQQIAGVQVEERHRRSKNGNTLKDYRLNLLFKTGAGCPMSDFTSNSEGLQRSAQTLKQFLRL